MSWYRVLISLFLPLWILWSRVLFNSWFVNLWLFDLSILGFVLILRSSVAQLRFCLIARSLGLSLSQFLCFLICEFLVLFSLSLSVFPVVRAIRFSVSRFLNQSFLRSLDLLIFWSLNLSFSRPLAFLLALLRGRWLDRLAVSSRSSTWRPYDSIARSLDRSLSLSLSGFRFLDPSLSISRIPIRES